MAILLRLIRYRDAGSFNDEHSHHPARKYVVVHQLSLVMRVPHISEARIRVKTALTRRQAAHRSQERAAAVKATEGQRTQAGQVNRDWLVVICSPFGEVGRGPIGVAIIV